MSVIYYDYILLLLYNIIIIITVLLQQYLNSQLFFYFYWVDHFPVGTTVVFSQRAAQDPDEDKGHVVVIAVVPTYYDGHGPIPIDTMFGWMNIY